MTNDVSPRWPHRFPVFRFLGLGAALLCGFLFIRLWVRSAPPLESFYFPTYVQTTLFADLPTLPSRHGNGSLFDVVFVGPYLANEQLLEHPKGPVRVRRVALKPPVFGVWLHRYIYHNRSLATVLRWPLAGFGICLIWFIGAGAFLDRSHNKEARNGRLLRGPGLISRWRFNTRTRGNGLRFRLENFRNPIEWLKRGDSGRDLFIQRDKEAHHIQIAGDTGTGKSTLVRQIVSQIEARDEVALLEDEVNPVMPALLGNGFDVTALHNHFFFESPRIFFMHVHGHGKATDLATRIKPAIDLIGHGSTQQQSSV
jgi:Domain of Unknown Function (DUF1259)/Type IV secretion-system coupling protein DNA-binding domain